MQGNLMVKRGNVHCANNDQVLVSIFINMRFAFETRVGDITNISLL